MARGQLLQFGNQLLVTAFMEVSLNAPSQHLDVQPLQVRHPLVPQQLGRYIHQRCAPPQAQRLRRGSRGFRPSAGADRGVGLMGQRLEPARVQFVAGHLDRVAGGTCHDPRRGLLVQPPTQSHDQRTDCFRRSTGRRAVPHHLGQFVGWHRPVRPPQQHGQHGPQPGRRDHLGRVRVPRHHLQGPQHPELQGVSSSERRPTVTRLSPKYHACMRASTSADSDSRPRRAPCRHTSSPGSPGSPGSPASCASPAWPSSYSHRRDEGRRQPIPSHPPTRTNPRHRLWGGRQLRAADTRRCRTQLSRDQRHHHRRQ